MNAQLQLSPREYEVAQVWALGLTAHEIAEKLFIAYDTVRNHKAKILKKLGLDNAVQVCLAINNIEPNHILNTLGAIISIIVLLNR